MPTPSLHPQQYRPPRPRGLRLRRHLKSMHRIHSRIRIPSHQQNRRILHPTPHMMIRRVSIKPLKLFRILRRPILRNPKPRNLKILIPQHIEQRHPANHSPKQLRTLRHHRPPSNPPFEAPEIARCAASVYFEEIKYEAAAIMSSKTFCFLSSIPARCQSSPNSAPPRKFATA